VPADAVRSVATRLIWVKKCKCRAGASTHQFKIEATQANALTTVIMAVYTPGPCCVKCGVPWDVTAETAIGREIGGGKCL